jgi:AbrB family looped-hinge helix DNA binding protein
MESAKSVVTSKFQTTIPKRIRDNMNLSVRDTLDWEIEDDRVVVRTIKNDFLTYKNTIKTGSGSTVDDIVLARKLRAKKYR